VRAARCAADGLNFGANQGKQRKEAIQTAGIAAASGQGDRYLLRSGYSLEIIVMQDSVPESPTPSPPPPRSHSRLGLVSPILSIGAALSLLGVFALAAIVAAINPNLVETETPVLFLLAGLIYILGILLAAIGLILGIAGIFMRERHKLFPVLGTAINTTMLVILLGLLGAGLALQN